MTQKAPSLQFHTVTGKNVILQNNKCEAKFCPIRSGGSCFSAQDIKPGDSVTVELEGSGHVEIGITSCDPSTMARPAFPQASSEIKAFRLLNEVRQHKRQCVIKLTRNVHGDLIESLYGEANYPKRVAESQKYWVVLYTRFGQVTARFATNEGTTAFQFSDHHGGNIRLMGENTQATTLLANPCALCFVDKKLVPGSKVILQCAPIQDGEKLPSRYHLKLCISQEEPTALSRSNPDLLDVWDLKPSGSPLTSLEILEKEECSGCHRRNAKVVVNIEDGNIVSYVSASGKVNKQRLNFDVAAGVWLALELYRISVVLESLEPRGQIPLRTSAPANLEPSRTLGKRASDLPGHASEAEDRHPYNTIDEGEDLVDARLEYKPPASDSTDAMAAGLRRQTSAYCQVNDARSPRESLDLHVKVDRLTNKVDAIFTVVGENMPFVSPPREQLRAGQVTPPAAGAAAQAMGDNCDGPFVTESMLRKNWIALLKDITFTPLCDYLYQRNIMSLDELSQTLEISKTNRREALQKLLPILCRKRVSVQLMRTILDESELGHLKEYFPDE